MVELRPPRLGIIRGDASGAREALEIALAVLERLGVAVDARWQDIGQERYLRTGELLPEQVVRELRDCDAILCGSPPASRDPSIVPGTLERGIVFGLRRELDLATNIREFRESLADDAHRIVVVRENSEGLFFNEGLTLHPGTGHETAIETATSTHLAVSRCVRHAFAIAQQRGVGVTLAHKPKVMVSSGRLWTRVFDEVAAEHVGVRTSVENIDTCCGLLLVDPHRYDVVVTDNVFGDILSDVVCGRFDAASYASSAELSASAGGPSLFEPMHGPQGDPGNAHPVSPFGALHATAAMLDHLDLGRAGAALRRATFACLRDATPSSRLVDAVAERALRALDQGEE